MPSTIRDLTELTTVAPDDYVLISDTSDVTNRDKRISRLNLVGGALTGNGTLATGGFTLTVPATGTASLLGTAQSFTALKTFSAGINLGQTANLVYFDQAQLLMTINGTGGAPTVTYSQRDGYWQRFNNVVYFHWFVAITTISGGSGSLRMDGLPFTAATGQQPRCFFHVDQVVVPGSAPFSQAMYAASGQTFMSHFVYQNNVAVTTYALSAFGAGDSIACHGFYIAA